jgi:tetratricopeptide (TPR) repeat protein
MRAPGLSLPLILTLVSGAALVVGCAQRAAPDADTAAPSAPGAPTDPLAALEASQESRPDELALALPPQAWNETGIPAALPAAELAPGTKATRSLEETLTLLRAERQPIERVVRPADTEALHLYSSGRLKLADRKAAEAIEDLEAAAKIDPDAAEIWRALGEAQFGAGRRQNGIGSFTKAVSLGLNEAVAHWMIGRDALRSKRADEAVKSLVLAIDAPDMKAESDLGVLVKVDLADALAAAGSLRAAREALTGALTTPFGSLAYSRFRPELAEVFRKRPELWTRAGDLACRLGDPESALKDYAEASALNPVDPVGVWLRSVRAELARGRSAAAARILLQSLTSSNGRIDDRQVAAIGTLASLPSVGRAVSTRLREMASSAAISPTLASRLTRAAAAAASPRESIELLRDLVAMRPWDGAAVVDLLARFGDDQGAERERELVALTARSPVDAPVYASACLALGRGVDDFITRLASDTSPNAGMLRAYLTAALGKPVEGLSIARAIPGDSAAKWRCVAEVAVAAGAYEEALAACEKIPTSTPDDLRAAASAWASSARSEQAAGAILKELDLRGDAAPVARIIAGARAKVSTGDTAGGERLLARAIEADKFDESAYESMLELYAPGGPLADTNKLGATARSLRQNVPSSRVLRTVQAQDSMARSLWSMAETQLISLVEESYESPQVLALLVDLWERAAKAEPELTARGESWLRTRLASRPESTLLNAALARVLVATGNPAGAEELLKLRTERWPVTDLCRLREQILRDQLDRAEDADALAQARLEASPPTIGVAMEWFEFLAERGDFESAASKLGSMLPEGTPLPPESLVRIGQALGRLSGESVVAKGEPACRAVAALFTRVIDGKVALPPSVHVVRLEILARGLPREQAMITRAVRDIGALQPDLEDPAVNQCYRWIAEAAEVSVALRFLEEYTNTHPQPTPDLVAAVVQQVGLRGTLEDAERVVRNLVPLQAWRTVLERIDPDSARDASGGDGLRAELAYFLALRFASRDQEADARSLYKVALTLNPAHGWSANNLGYSLVESGEDLVEGERLLEIAIAALPEEASVIDSVAWLRYLQGHIEDYDRNGTRIVGALTLIKMAVGEGKSPSAEVLDHAGDIHWKADRKTEAVDYWKKAVIEAEFEIGAGRQRGLTEAETARFSAISDRARKKLSAAEGGANPELGGLASPER